MNTQSQVNGISVVIVNYQTPQYLEKILSQLHQNYPQLDDIVVVDNHSGDNAVQLLRQQFPEVKVVASEVNAGYATAVNWGINYTHNEYILLLNPDIEIHNNAIETLHRRMKDDPSLGVVAPKLLNFDQTLQYSCFTFHSLLTPFYRRTPLAKIPHGQRDLARFMMYDFDHKSEKEVDWVLGSAMLVRRKAIDAVGLMDERFFLYFEDVDWCRRFWDKGWKILYYPEAVMLHKHRRLSAPAEGLRGSFNQVTRIHIRSWLRYLHKYKGRPAPVTK